MSPRVDDKNKNRRSAGTEAHAVPLSAMLERALTLHREGKLAQAQAAYARILECEPANFDALHLSGVIAGQSKRLDKARKLIAKALSCDPDNAAAHAAHANLGNVLLELGQPAMALESYDRALTLRDDYAPAQVGRAAALAKLSQLDAAVEAYERAIQCGIADANVHQRLGDVLARLGRWEAALASYDSAIARGAGSAELHSNRAAALIGLRRWGSALASCDRAITVQADFAPAYGNRGNALQELRRFEEAVASYDRGVALVPKSASMHASRGAALISLRRWEEALASCERAIACNGEHPEGHCNRGSALHAMGRLDEALASYERAIELRADYAEAHSNRGYLLMDRHQLDAAMDCYERAIACRSDYAEVHGNRAMLRLLTADMPGGWEDYEWRWLSRHGPGIEERRDDLPGAPWRGAEPLTGKRILLHSEQGLGDTIQFCRYTTAVAGLGAQVILEVQPSLRTLLSNLPGVAQLLTRGEPLPEFDFRCPLLSLPLAFRTDMASIPSCGGGYLHSDPLRVAHWRQRLPQGGTPLVGLAWSGNARHGNDRNRSIPLAALVETLPREFHYVSLQNEVRASDESALQGSAHILDERVELKDFADTAALCECLDLIVTVDTSVAHLAGALGRPTWVLLPFVPDWRWLLDRVDSPWYRSVTLYRQPRAGDWRSVLERVAADLRSQAELKDRMSSALT